MARMASIVAALLVLTSNLAAQDFLAADQRWSREKAGAWHKQQPWLVGCNYIPSTAINQLEMWQADTFDPKTIDRELGWAENLGFTSVRVFLHDLPWKEDAVGFAKRIDRFLEIADKHKIRVMFVLLDSCWHPEPKSGKQPAPTPHLHNSGWVQCPGVAVLRDTEKWKGGLPGMRQPFPRGQQRAKTFLTSAGNGHHQMARPPAAYAMQL